MINIPGLNSETANALYGGDQDIYFIVIRSFITNAAAIITKLNAVTEDNLQEYVITIHGLKGILAGIAAEDLSENAYKLETIARSGDYEGVIAGNDEFIKKTEKLIFSIKSYMEKIDLQESKPKLSHPDKTLLKRIVDYCSNYNINGIDDILYELESYDYDEGSDIVKWLREKADDLDFSEIERGLKEYNL